MRVAWPLGVGTLIVAISWLAIPNGPSTNRLEPPVPRRVTVPTLPDVVPSLSRTMLKRPGSMELALAARRGLDRRPRGYRDDCSGFISGVLTGAGVPADASVMQFWELAEHHGATHLRDIPYIGDLAFFDFTYDRDNNGRNDDLKTHIAIVTDVEPDGTIVMAHRGTKSGRSIIRMNLTEPTVHETDDGKVLNSWLHARGRATWGGWHLTGELWSGFASPSRDEQWVYADVLGE